MEVCPDAGVITEKIVDRFNASNTNGCFLVCDYGYDEGGESTQKSRIKDTFRGFKNHDSWDPLKDPGTADLTADVDFAFLKRMVLQKGQSPHSSVSSLKVIE
jgi:NADH dehydrogenase [ubiquinone] 1 alpha subcomplex assembly factor 7